MDSRHGTVRRGRRWGWALIAALSWAIGAGAEMLRLKDGSSVEGTLKRTEGGYDVTTAEGKVVHVDASNVERIELTTRPVGNVEAQQRLASLRRSVENLSDLNAIIEQFTRFVDQNKASPAAQEAEHDLAVWRERRDKGMVKVGAQWVTADERRVLRDRLGATVEQARLALAKGQVKEADALVRQALDVDPNDAGAAYLRGVMLLRQDQLPPAKKAFDTAAASLKDHAPTLNNIAVILWRQNQQMAALNFYLQAMAAAPGTRPVLDNVAEALNALPAKERQFPLAQRAARAFADQDAELQRRMAAAGWYRWGSTWVDRDQFTRLQALERQIKGKIDELSKAYDETKKKVDQIDSDIDENVKRMRIMEQMSVGVDAQGNVYTVPLPAGYYQMQRENRQMSQDRADDVTKLEGLRAEARKVQQQMPTPRFTGQQRPIGPEGMPGAPAALVAAPEVGLTRPEPTMPTEWMPPPVGPAATRPAIATTGPVMPPPTQPATVEAPRPPAVVTPPLPIGVGGGAGPVTRPAPSYSTTQPERARVPESLLAPG